MRFDDDTAAPTTLVRTPPHHAGERVVYEVSDEYVDQAVAAVKEHLDDGEQPLVGRIDAPTADEFQEGAEQYAEENPGNDALADYATSMAFQAHEQKTGERIDESGRFDLDGETRAAFHPNEQPAQPEPDDDEPKAPRKAQGATKKAAARQHHAED